MNNIGGWAAVFSKLSLEQYLSKNPPAVFVQARDAGSYKVETEDPGMTLFRMEPSAHDMETRFPDGTPDPEDRANAYLILPLGPAERPSGPQRYSLGCDENADLRISDASISRNHAWIERNGDTYLIEDSGSTLGTKIEGERLLKGKRHELKSGEALIIGEVELTFLEPAAFYRFVKFYMEGQPTE